MITLKLLSILTFLAVLLDKRHRLMFEYMKEENLILREHIHVKYKTKRYQLTAERTNARAGHYKRKLHTRAGEVRNVSVLMAVDVGMEGYRDILGIAEGDKEDKEGWGQFPVPCDT